MTAVRIGPDMRMAVVGSPGYFKDRPAPKKPQQLTDYNCIGLRLPTHGGLYAWEFEKDGRELLECASRVNSSSMAPRKCSMPALMELGIACVPEGMVQPYMARGRLKRLLEDWCLPFPGYHLWYPSRRQASPAFALLVEALRYRG